MFSQNSACAKSIGRIFSAEMDSDNVADNGIDGGVYGHVSLLNHIIILVVQSVGNSVCPGAGRKPPAGWFSEVLAVKMGKCAKGLRAVRGKLQDGSPGAGLLIKAQIGEEGGDGELFRIW